MFARVRFLIALVVLALVAAGCADEGGELFDSSAGAATTVPPATAVSDLHAASDKKDATDTRLANALGRVGPMLTATQSQSFAKAFNALPDVVAVQTDYQTKAQTLADALGQVATDPAQIASYGPKNLLAGYAILAQTPQAPAALDFATKVLAKQIVLDGVSDADILDQVLGPSLGGAYLQSLITTGTVPNATAATVKVLSRSTSVGLNIAGWIQRYNAFKEVDLLSDYTGISSVNTISGLRTVAGLIAIWTIGDDLFQGNPQQAMLDFLNSGGNAVSGVTSAMQLFRRVVSGVENTPLADDILKWTGRIALGVGLVMGAISLWNDSGKWNDSTAAKVRVAADVVALTASILCIVATGPVGAIAGTVALGLSFFADWLQAREVAAEELTDIKACLPAVDLDDALAQAIINADPNQIATLSTKVNLAPDQVQWLLSVDPNAVNASTDAGITFMGLQVAEKIFTLDGAKTVAMMQAAAGDATGDDAAVRVDLFLRGLDFSLAWSASLSPSDALDWLTQAAAETVPDEEAANRTAAFTGAHDFLANLQ